MLTQFYGPHIQKMEKLKRKGKGQITKTQMLVKLHSAAIVIQQNFRKYKARKGFYTNSLTYINTSEDEAFADHKDMTINDDRVNDPIPFSSISPDKVINYQNVKRDDPNKVEASIIVPTGNQFYSLNSSIVDEKVVQLSVISSGRPDDSRSIAKVESGENSNQQSLIITPNNLNLPRNGAHKIEIPQKTQPHSGFSTVIKNSIDNTN